VVVDQEIGGLHVSMQYLASMQIVQTFQKLQHVTFDLGLCETDRGIFKEARQIVVHVGRDHVHICPFCGFALWVFDSHFLELEDVRM